MNPKQIYPETTLFLNLSVDGRITSHDSDLIDPDKNWKQTPGIRGLLQQFYDFNQLNMAVLTTGIVMNNLGVNTRSGKPKPEDITLIVLDPDADLTPKGITYLSQNVKKLYYVCLKSNHDKLPIAGVNVIQIAYPHEIDLNDLFSRLYKIHHLKKLFVHSIAPLNASLLDAGLINHLTVIITPILVGDHGTPALPKSPSLTLRPLKLVSLQSFNPDCVSLRYDL